jgi:hypothetical protein
MSAPPRRPAAIGCTLPVLVENSVTGVGLGFHAACWYSLISPASLVRRWIRAAGTGAGDEVWVVVRCAQFHAVTL